MREQDKQMLADHYLDFYRMAYNLLHNEADTEDVVQDALAITMSRPFVAKPYNYCAKVLYNRCYRLLSRGDYYLPGDVPDMVAEEDGIDEYRLQQIQELKDLLPPRIAKVLDLYYVNGLTQMQIAEHQGMSESLVKKLFYKGHKRLRQQIMDIDNNKQYNNG